MDKDVIISNFLSPKYVNDTYGANQYNPRPRKTLELPIDLKYGVEFEFPYDKRQEANLFYNFNLYNKSDLHRKWTFSKEVNTEYPPNICIGEFTSPILGIDLNSLDQLNIITQLIRAFEHNILKAKNRNMHFHFDMKLLGDSLEYLVPYLQVFRSYENIIARICSSETGRVPKKGLSNRIHKALKGQNVSEILRIYNGGEYNCDNLLEYRKLAINLFNVGAFYEAHGKTPAVLGTKSNNIFQKYQNAKLTLDSSSYDKSKETIVKKLTPTFETRMSPTTTNLGYFQQYLLLHSTIIFMARNLKDIPGLEEKVKYRNDLIDKCGPQVFDLEFDEGIADLLELLPIDSSSRLLLPYLSSKQICLYKSPLVQE